MTESDDPFFRYETHSRAFLERAKSNLGLFRNSGDPEMLFRSALHLRYGIEGRLNEYIAATLEICGRADKKISDYSATKLLKRLRMLTPKTQDRMFVRFSAGANEPSTTLEYIPVSSILASVHGQLGELLHHNFFINNPNWMLKSQSVPNSRRETLRDFECLLDIGVGELSIATSGRLLTSPAFSIFFDEVDCLAGDDSDS